MALEGVHRKAKYWVQYSCLIPFCRLMSRPTEPGDKAKRDAKCGRRVIFPTTDATTLAPGVNLTYVKLSGESDGAAGDKYIGLDTFGRVVDQALDDKRRHRQGPPTVRLPLVRATSNREKNADF